MGTLVADLLRTLAEYPASKSALLSLVVVVAYPFVVMLLTSSYRRSLLRSGVVQSWEAARARRVDYAWWLYYIPLPLLLMVVNYHLFFFWLPRTPHGKTLMIRYVLYRLTFGVVTLSSETSRRAYAYLFSGGSQLVMLLLVVGGLTYLAHEWVCRRHPELRRIELDGYLFLFPALAVIVVFNISPVFFSLFLSMHRGTAQDIFKEFVFLDHYRTLLGDSTFWISMRNTAWFALGSVPLTIACSLFIAMLLNRKIRGLSFYRTVYFLPVITSVAAISLVWRWVYHPQRGIINVTLHAFGSSGLDWLYEPRGIFDLFSMWLFDGRCSDLVRTLGGYAVAPVGWILGSVPTSLDWVFTSLLPGVAEGPSLAITAVIVMSAWKGLGYNVIIFLAGLQNIPGELYEAARIDGAGIYSQFRNVTWPLLSPTTYFVLIMSTIQSFQVFAQIFMLYAGNATDGSRVVVYYLFEKGFQTFEFGYASALAYMLFLVIFVLTHVQRRFVGEKVHYD